MKKNYSLYGLPEEVIFCSNCTISNQRPRSVVEFKNNGEEKKGIGLNKITGVCEACEYSKTKDNIDWKERERKLKELLNKKII